MKRLVRGLRLFWHRWGIFIYFWLGMANTTSGLRQLAVDGFGAWSITTLVVGFYMYYLAFSDRRKELNLYGELAMHSHMLVKLIEGKQNAVLEHFQKGEGSNDEDGQFDPDAEA